MITFKKYFCCSLSYRKYIYLKASLFHYSKLLIQDKNFTEIPLLQNKNKVYFFFKKKPNKQTNEGDLKQ